MRIEKISLVAALAVGTLLACAGTSSAQDATKEVKKGRAGFAQAQVSRMDTVLNLSADQKTKLTALYEDEAVKMRELRSETNSTPEVRREKVRSMREQNDKKLKEILTPEQWDKWQKSRQEMRPRRGEGNGAGKKAPEKQSKD